ncbi:protein nessun dorma [Anopheles bellator]|uniref:protein nessun dorma n=1 Tax=Anopheles bellator TaxID=139047 RepID=UPI00264A0C32|nr:protein nessun dorma [Anopheles bellator]
MEVYEFKKTFLTRMLETENVLNGGGCDIPASAIRSEWINFVEVVIESTGWQALWQASRAVCERLSVKFPLVVLGTVDQVLFDELKASFIVEAIQDDDVHLPEKLVVNLEELYPLREQNNPALNVDTTADCIDKLRFFYQHLWMPWDGVAEDDSNWLKKNLETRIRFCHDLKNKTMSWRLSSHAIALLADARYIEKKLKLCEEAELEADDDEEDDNETSLLKNERSCELLKLNLRLNNIRNEIEILQNPVMRAVYEKVRFSCGTGQSPKAYVVTQVGTIDQQLAYLEQTKAMIDPKVEVKMCDSLQHALDHCPPNSDVYLPPGSQQDIRFLQYLNSGGSIRGVGTASFINDSEQALKTNAVVVSKDGDSVLLTIDGDFTLENIHFDCLNVRTGVMVKKGNVVFRNCSFAGDPPTSSTKQGILIFGSCSITLENCIIKNFSTGIYSNHDCSISLVNSIIQNCGTGVEILDQTKVLFKSATVCDSRQYGVLLEDFNEDEEAGETLKSKISRVSNSSQIYEDYNTVGREEFSFEGHCEFRGNAKGNFAIRKGCSSLFNSSCFIEDDEESGDEYGAEDTFRHELTACHSTNTMEPMED